MYQAFKIYFKGVSIKGVPRILKAYSKGMPSILNAYQVVKYQSQLIFANIENPCYTPYKDV